MDQSKVIFITGATSGIGAACTAYFSHNGWKVYGGSRRIVREITTPEGAVLFPLDVTRRDEVQNVVSTILEREGHLEVAINNAGYGIGGPLEMTTVEEAKEQFETNFFGVHLVNRIVLPYLRDQGHGRIILIGSIGGRIGLPFQGMYSATKFALEGYAEALSMEVKEWGVEVLLVEPGDFATGFTGERKIVAETEPYSAQFQTALNTIESDETGGKSPDIIAQKLFRVLNRRRLPRKMMAGAWDQKLAVKIKALLPRPWFEYIIRSHYFG